MLAEVSACRNCIDIHEHAVGTEVYHELLTQRGSDEGGVISTVGDEYVRRRRFSALASWHRFNCYHLAVDGFHDRCVQG
jgi:hypothetical protein